MGLIDIKLNIIYEDNHLLVCHKPEGVLSQKDHTNDIDMVTLVNEYLVKKYNKPNNAYVGLVHRLDRRVSGVMVFCKTSKAANRLSEQIRNHQMKKRYLCISKGYFDGEKQLVSYLTKDDLKAKTSEEGKKCVLDYKVVDHFTIGDDKFSVCIIDLMTGRFNQIRMQMAEISHPIINDFKYGYKGKNYEDSLGLRCVELSFYHPITKELLTFKDIKENEEPKWRKYLEISRYE